MELPLTFCESSMFGATRRLDSERSLFFIIDKNGRHIAECYLLNHAEYIVKACNANI